MRRERQKRLERRAPTVREVAALADVSVATVSRVLNGGARVDPVRRDRVLSAIAALGYRRDAVARNLRRGSTRAWGLVISDIQNPFFTGLIRGVQDQAEREGYSVVLVNTDENLAREAAAINLLMEERVAGALVSPVSIEESDLGKLIASRTPVVFIDRRLDDETADSVLVDNERGAYEGTRHLLEVGFRRVACITGPQTSTTGRLRFAGYRRALEEAELTPQPDLVRVTDFKREGGRQAALDLLGGKHRPDSLIVMNNLMTEGALQGIAETGLEVPADLGLVGFDDLSWATLVRPQLTAIAQPVYEVGRVAAELLARRCRGDWSDHPTTRTLETTLVVRQSSLKGPSVGRRPLHGTFEGRP